MYSARCEPQLVCDEILLMFGSTFMASDVRLIKHLYAKLEFITWSSCSWPTDIYNPLTLELNRSAQLCLTRFFLLGILRLEPCISLIYA
jgi:hypothetical protein